MRKTSSIPYNPSPKYIFNMEDSVFSFIQSFIYYSHIKHLLCTRQCARNIEYLEIKKKLPH